MGRTINISRNHSLGLQTARQKAEQVASSLQQESWAKGMTTHWAGDQLAFEIPSVKVKGSLTVTQSSITVFVDSLPFFLMPMASKIEASVNEYLNNAGIRG